MYVKWLSVMSRIGKTGNHCGLVCYAGTIQHHSAGSELVSVANQLNIKSADGEYFNKGVMDGRMTLYEF